MRLRKSVNAISTMLVLTVLLAAGCSDDAPTAPTTAELDERRAQLTERVAKKKAKAGAAAPAQAGAPGQSQGDFAAVAVGYSYSAKGKRDPFRSFVWEPPDGSEEIRGPLEQYDVAQLSLLAVVWATGNARALVVDPAGQTFIIGQGTRVGKNSGEVTKIEDNLVVVKETYEDFTGQKTVKDVEMRIRASEGG